MRSFWSNFAHMIRALAFEGALIANELLDFHGALRLQAKVSQTQTGVKRWLLKLPIKHQKFFPPTRKRSSPARPRSLLAIRYCNRLWIACWRMRTVD